MKQRFRMFLRDNGYFYSEDAVTRQQKSLHTKDQSQAQVLLSVKNKEYEIPTLNLAVAKTFLQATHPHLISITWEDVLKHFIQDLPIPKRAIWERMGKSSCFSFLGTRPLLETEPYHFWRFLRHPETGTSNQRLLKRLHVYALDAGLLLVPIFTKTMWPKLRKKPRRAITSEEHRRIVEAETDTERRHYYEMLWLRPASNWKIINS